jgi:hypothetical protein
MMSGSAPERQDSYGMQPLTEGELLTELLTRGPTHKLFAALCIELLKARAEVVPEGGGDAARAVCKVIAEARATLDPDLDKKAEEVTLYLRTDVSLDVRSRRVPPLPPLTTNHIKR